MGFAGVFERGWMPLAVIACGGFAVSRVRSGFGSETPSAYSNSTATDTLLSPKSMVYKVFGPVGTAADVGYFDVTSGPHRAMGALRWSLQITAIVAAVMGNVIAHNDNNSVGSRIVNGQVEAERISNDVNAYTHCLVKGV
jgi:Mycobacterium membrane protein